MDDANKKIAVLNAEKKKLIEESSKLHNELDEKKVANKSLFDRQKELVAEVAELKKFKANSSKKE